MSAPENMPLPLADSASQEDAARLAQFQQAFPLGLAPYRRVFLWIVGILLTPMGAAIFGSVNLRRTGQSRSIPLLFLIAILIMILSDILEIVILERHGVTLVEDFLVRYVLNHLPGFLFAEWIARRQQASVQQWISFAGPAHTRERGGMRNLLGWLFVTIVICAVLFLVFYLAFYPFVYQIIYPAQRLTVQDVTINLPAGWIEIEPKDVGLDCEVSSYTCVTVIRERFSQNRIAFLVMNNSNEAESPQSLIEFYADQFKVYEPSATIKTQEDFSMPALGSRNASSLNAYIAEKDMWQVYTAVADEDRIIVQILYCASSYENTCEERRDYALGMIDFTG